MGSFARANKAEICDYFLEQLRRRPDLNLPAAEYDQLREHFRGLPTRYATDVNVESLDVLNHKRLLDAARADEAAVSFQVRSVEVVLGRAVADDNVVYSPGSSFSEVRART
eukprot:scaffold184977_cov46-Prasinocladus_malaysianus.AAC.1